ncbi:MAG: hypothetical protein A2107_11650 [Verrucomicrobia bacterium GWF2_62_7]|nr:MAG: hypothetical protein A2107_11650 [Verrucomicrobia bacterium GWF2_62_7]
MNRICLITLATTLLFANPAWSRTINLMSLIDPKRDAVKGEWRFQDRGLVSDNTTTARLQIPFQPPEEYDFRIEFVCLQRTQMVCQIFSQTGRAAMFVMGGGSGNLFGFSLVDAKRSDNNRTTAGVDSGLGIKRSHTSLLQVRRGGVRAFFNGKLTSEWKTNYKDANLSKFWEMPSHQLLGIGSRSRTTFHVIELLEIAGKGKPVTPPSTR